jgi:excisionase family DNA binding protein
MNKQDAVRALVELLATLADSKSAEAQSAPVTEIKPVMLTIDECVAEVAGVTKHAVRTLVKRGEIPCVRVGERNGKILVNRADLLSYFNNK